MTVQSEMFDKLKEKPREKSEILREFGYQHFLFARRSGMIIIDRGTTIKLADDAVRPIDRRRQPLDDFTERLKKLLKNKELSFSEIEIKLNARRPKLIRAARMIGVKIEKRGRTTFWSLPPAKAARNNNNKR